MTFGNPRMLWLLLATVPALIAFLYWSWRRKQQLITQFVHARLLANLTVGLSPTLVRIKSGLLVLAVASLFLALARPLWGFAWEEARQRGLDIIVAIDTSRSMLAEDVTPNRLRRAQLAAMDLLRLAKQDRLGLIAFAGTAFLQCPLTLDEEAFRQSVEALDTSIIPQGGTALTEAITTAVGSFKESEGENHKVLVLFTDGEDHEPGAVAAAEEAAKRGVRIFTVGVGTVSGEILRHRDEKGAMTYLKDDQGNVVKSRLDETTLTQIATAANGFYLQLSGARTMDTLYSRGLDPLPKSELTSTLVKQYHDRYQWPLGLGILCLLLELALPQRRKSTASAGPAAPANSDLKKALAAIAIGLLVQGGSALEASPASALRQYQAKDYGEARREFERLLEKKPGDPRLHYNAGVAAFQEGKWSESARHLSAATTATDLDLQQKAYYNLGNTLFRVGEQEEEPGKKKDAWEQALKQYEGSLNLAEKLKRDDPDAQFNRDLVKKRLEELKKQNKEDPSNKDQQDQKDESKEDQDKQDQDKNDQQKSDPDQKEKQDSPQPDPKENPDQKKDPDQKNQSQQDQSQENKPQPGDGSEDKPEEKQPGDEGEPATPLGQMTQKQAMQLLDAQKSDEKAMIFRPPKKARTRVFKDW